MIRYHISHEYNVDLWSEGVCDQGATERGWLYAALNPLRQRASRTLDIRTRNFQLSRGFVLYHVLLERSERFLDAVPALKALSPRSLQTALTPDPVDDRGQWADLASTVKKHGLVPLAVMPDAGCHHRADGLFLLNNRLRLGAKQMLAADDPAAVRATILADAAAILDEHLGSPPKTFDFPYFKKDGTRQVLSGLTPMDFYKTYCGGDLDDYLVISHPAGFGEPVEMQTMKAAVVRQLVSGEQVVVGTDTRFQSAPFLGILDTDLAGNETVFGSDLVLSKAEKIACGLLTPRHALSLDGVQLEDGEPVRFKAQDSHGGDTGADGHFTMSAAWFESYVLYAVVRREFLK